MQVISTEYMDYPSTHLLYTAQVRFLLFVSQAAVRRLPCLPHIETPRDVVVVSIDAAAEHGRRLFLQGWRRGA